MMQLAMDLATLLTRAAGGEAAARELLLRQWYPRVRDLVHRHLERDFRLRHRWLLPLFSTGDFVQEAFLGVVRNFEGLPAAGADGSEGGDDAVLRYLSTVVKHRILDAVRHHEAARRDDRRVAQEPERGMGVLPSAAMDPTPSSQASVVEQLAIYERARAELPQRQQLLLEMRLVDEKPWADVAEDLGYASADAARKAFREAQAKLLVKLRAHGMRPPGETER